jgi:hypothetical protein
VYAGRPSARWLPAAIAASPTTSERVPRQPEHEEQRRHDPQKVDGNAYSGEDDGKQEEQHDQTSHEHNVNAIQWRVACRGDSDLSAPSSTLHPAAFAPYPENRLELAKEEGHAKSLVAPLRRVLVMTTPPLVRRRPRATLRVSSHSS